MTLRFGLRDFILSVIAPEMFCTPVNAVRALKRPTFRNLTQLGRGEDNPTEAVLRCKTDVESLLDRFKQRLNILRVTSDQALSNEPIFMALRCL